MTEPRTSSFTHEHVQTRLTPNDLSELLSHMQAYHACQPAMSLLNKTFDSRDELLFWRSQRNISHGHEWCSRHMSALVLVKDLQRLELILATDRNDLYRYK